MTWSDTARRQAIDIQSWWAEHREEAPSLFLDELFDLAALLQQQPRLGLPYVHPRAVGLRRLLLVRSSYQLFYRLDEARREVELVAVWHAIRGASPPL